MEQPFLFFKIQNLSINKHDQQFLQTIVIQQVLNAKFSFQVISAKSFK